MISQGLVFFIKKNMKKMFKYVISIDMPFIDLHRDVRVNLS